MKYYHCITSMFAFEIKARCMEEACQKALKHMMLTRIYGIEEDKMYFNEFKVALGKLPEHW